MSIGSPRDLRSLSGRFAPRCCWRAWMLSRRTKVVQLRNQKPRLTFLHVRPQHASCRDCSLASLGLAQPSGPTTHAATFHRHACVREVSRRRNVLRLPPERAACVLRPSAGRRHACGSAGREAHGSHRRRTETAGFTSRGRLDADGMVCSSTRGGAKVDLNIGGLGVVPATRVDRPALASGQASMRTWPLFARNLHGFRPRPLAAKSAHDGENAAGSRAAVATASLSWRPVRRRQTGASASQAPRRVAWECAADWRPSVRRATARRANPGS